MSWMPDVMVTSPVPGKGLAFQAWTPFLPFRSLCSQPPLPPLPPVPTVPPSLTSGGGSHGSCPVPQLGGNEGPVELPAFLPDHTSAVAYPQPWRGGSFMKLNATPPPQLSPSFFPQTPAAAPLEALTTLGVEPPGWNAGARSKGTRLGGHGQGQVNGA